MHKSQQGIVRTTQEMQEKALTQEGRLLHKEVQFLAKDITRVAPRALTRTYQEESKGPIKRQYIEHRLCYKTSTRQVK